jgi:PAS domain-containing protein
VRTGQSELLAEIPDEPLLAAAKDAEHLRMIRELGMKSRMIVPLWSRGRVLGTMTLVLAEAGRHYSAADLALAEDLARRAAIAVDNAQLYTAAQKELEDRKRVEQELKRSKDQLEVILSSVADGITLQDASGKLIYANDVAGHSAGYRAGKQNVAGEGMGLAYVQALVRRHSGRIWYESKVDKGTTFSFTIVHYREQRPEPRNRLTASPDSPICAPDWPGIILPRREMVEFDAVASAHGSRRVFSVPSWWNPIKRGLLCISADGPWSGWLWLLCLPLPICCFPWRRRRRQQTRSSLTIRKQWIRPTSSGSRSGSFSRSSTMPSR